MTAPSLSGTRARPATPLATWLVTGMAVLFIAVSWADKAVLGLAATPLMRELGLSESQFGFVGSSFFFLSIVTCLFGGVLADRLRLRWVLFALVLGWSLTSVPVLASASLGTLLFGRVALGAVEGPANPVALALTYTWFPNDRRGLPSGLLNAGATIAKLAIAPLLAVIMGVWGWRGGFAALVVIGLVWCAAWLPIGRTGPYAAADTPKPVPEAGTGAADGGPLWRVALTRTFVGATVGNFAVFGLATLVITWLPSYFQAVLGLGEVQAGSLLGLPSVFGVVCLVGLGWTSDRMLRRGVSSRRARGVMAGCSMMIGGVLLTLSGYAPTVLSGVALLLLGYAGASGSQGLCAPAVAELVPPRRRAGTLGLYYAISTLSGVLAPWLTGVILDASATPAAGYRTTFTVFGLILAFGGVLYTVLVHPERDRARLESYVPGVRGA
jgi:MFS family permease